MIRTVRRESGRRQIQFKEKMEIKILPARYAQGYRPIQNLPITDEIELTPKPNRKTWNGVYEKNKPQHPDYQ